MSPLLHCDHLHYFIRSSFVFAAYVFNASEVSGKSKLQSGLLACACKQCERCVVLRTSELQKAQTSAAILHNQWLQNGRLLLCTLCEQRFTAIHFQVSFHQHFVALTGTRKIAPSR